MYFIKINMNKSEIITMYEIQLIILHIKMLWRTDRNCNMKAFFCFEHEFGVNRFYCYLHTQNVALVILNLTGCI